MMVKLKKPSELVVFVLRPGEEIFLVHNWFPHMGQTTLHFPDRATLYDVLFSYQVVEATMDQVGDGSWPCSKDSKHSAQLLVYEQ